MLLDVEMLLRTLDPEETMALVGLAINCCLAAGDNRPWIGRPLPGIGEGNGIMSLEEREMD
jgi:hypothetical protein